MRAVAVIVLCVGLGGCGLPVAVVTAGLGFGAAAFTFDTKLIPYVLGPPPMPPHTMGPVQP